MLREPTIEKLHAMRLRVLADTWLEQDYCSGKCVPGAGFARVASS